MVTGNCITRAGPAMLLLAGAATLAGCNRQHASRMSPFPMVTAAAAAPGPPEAAPARWFNATPPQQGAGLHLAYTHAIGLEVAGAALAAHFTAARDRCLNSPALHCLLLRASLSSTPAPESGRADLQNAELHLRLPHDQVAAFANALTDKLLGEAATPVRVIRQSTDAVDLGRPVADVAQRVAQLTDYLSSLKTMGGRLTISVSDLVKIASETAQAQTEIEEAQAQQRDLALRVDTEQLDIDFEQAAVEAVQDPVSQTWSQARAIFRRSVADALEFAIEALPWLPVAVIGLFLLALIRLILFGRRRRDRLAAPPRA